MLLEAEIWQDARQVDTMIATMAAELQTLLDEIGAPHPLMDPLMDPLMVGIHTGGVWLAEHLHQRLGLTEPLGHLDISFYRDDFTRIGLHPQVHPCELPVDVDDRVVILVDDVLQSGRTIRAALNVLFDYGRPARVLLAILAERDGRELPIQPNVVGLHAELEPGVHIKLSGPDPLRLEKRRSTET